jgi:iron-sulfur cluster insertion protein|tara:strand:- start:1168 stop:1488 length:321 start_codon:yes stop_codon:yes gene_type:complete
METMVTLTERAKAYMKSVCEGGYVTLGIRGGGCSGFQYVWGLSPELNGEDIQWSQPVEDILLLDPVAELHILGSEIDYVEELGGSFLKIINPLATSQCGCGESFSV